MRIDSRGRRRGLTQFILLPQLTSPHGPTPPRSEVRAKLFRLRRKSSIRPSAPSSLVALGWGPEERLEGMRRTGQVGALFEFSGPK